MLVYKHGTYPEQNGANSSQESTENKWKKSDKIPFKFFDMHDIMNMIIFEPYILEEHILPSTGFNIVTFNAHIDTIVPDDMQLRMLVKPSNQEDRLFHNFGLQSWIQEAAKKGYIKNVIWIKPPWTQGVHDGSRVLQITNEESNTSHEVSLDMKTLCRSVFEDVEEDYDGYKTLFTKLATEVPYMLDLELSFFSCDNSFTSDYEKCPTYYPLFKELFKINSPISMSSADLEIARNEREKNLKEIDEICKYLQEHKTMPAIEEEPTSNYQKIVEIKEELLKYYSDNEINWDNIYAAGMVCNEYQLPIHYTTRDDIKKMVKDCVSKVIDLLPFPPVVITVAIMYDYLNFSPEKDLDFIIDLLKELFKEKYGDALDGPEFIGY